MNSGYDPTVRRPSEEEDERQREEHDRVEREGFARDAGDPRWGTGGLRVDERAYRGERDRRAQREQPASRRTSAGREAAPPPRSPVHSEWLRAEWESLYAVWESTRGPYVGVGPRGYRRGDERIREEVCERFAEHGRLDPSDVEIGVRDGEVLLTGSVATRAQKRLAEDIADRVFGVVEVHNHLHVQGPMAVSQVPRGAPVANDRLAHPGHAGSASLR